MSEQKSEEWTTGDVVVIIMMLVLFGFIGSVLFYQETHGAHPLFVYTKTDATVSGTVDLTIPSEEQAYDYVYVVREPNPCPLSHAEDCPGWVYPRALLKIYAVRLNKDDGDGYIAMAVRDGTPVHDGERVVCGFRHMYYPRTNESHYSFWIECQTTEDGPKIPSIHSCLASEGEWVAECPDLDQVRHKPKLVYEP